MVQVESEQLSSRRIEIEEDCEVINKLAHERGWTDGNPIIPPTEERVERMFQYIDLSPNEVVGVLQPSGAGATVEKIAINAVMAGCLAEHMPIVLAAIEALADENFFLHQVQTTSHSVSPLLIVNGPIRQELDITSGAGGTLRSWHSSAAIGRAVRLALKNIGGVSGSSDMHTFGWLVKYGYCMGENEDESPWQPYHVEQGFKPADNTVTVFGVEPPHHIEPRSYVSAQGLLSAIADSMATTGCRNIHGDAFPLVVICTDHAKVLASEGFSKADVKRFLYEHVRVPLYRFDKGNIDCFSDEWKKFYTYGPHAMVPMVNSQDKFHIVVLGGPGPNSLFIPGFGSTLPIIKPIKWKGKER
ncbi:hypothetical protein ACFLWC_06510 [Chloroflexota bacterium]